MTKNLRLITRLLAAVLAAVMLSSAVYIAVEANHNCSGEDCAICHQLQACENLLKSIGLAGAAAVSPRRSGMPRAGSFPPTRRLSAHLLWFHSRSSFQIK